MEGSNGFGIDTILSHRAGSPGLAQGDPLMGESRSPLELSPRSEVSSLCSSPPSPSRECLDSVNTRQGVALAIESHLQPGVQLSAPSQSRTVTSSFLIRDILADCKPLATCAPYSSNGQPAQDLSHCLSSKAAEDFRDKLEKSSSSTSSESEYKGKVKEEGDREISSSRDSPPVRLKKPRKARTAFTDHQLAQLERSFERQKYLSVQDRMELAASLTSQTPRSRLGTRTGGQSGRGRLLLDWSCWQRRVITLPFRGCFLPHTFTHKALFPTWIPVQPSICTGDLQHLRQLCRDLWCPGSSFTDFRVALSHHLPCPL
ncbi:unnamed protein product [Staurois parvus]|uniref:Homeobox domain-containing protein n=1 Tax=Staurois parvus TaxID=386267 RepID=A0ABN9AE46_9NEOB|nr:unnamed protein product [Staurois parvus]